MERYRCDFITRPLDRGQWPASFPFTAKKTFDCIVWNNDKSFTIPLYRSVLGTADSFSQPQARKGWKNKGSSDRSEYFTSALFWPLCDNDLLFVRVGATIEAPAIRSTVVPCVDSTRCAEPGKSCTVYSAYLDNKISTMTLRAASGGIFHTILFFIYKFIQKIFFKNHRTINM